MGALAERIERLERLHKLTVPAKENLKKNLIINKRINYRKKLLKGYEK